MTSLIPAGAEKDSKVSVVGFLEVSGIVEV